MLKMNMMLLLMQVAMIVSCTEPKSENDPCVSYIDICDCPLRSADLCEGDGGNLGEDSVASDYKIITLHTELKHQKIEGFGASDAWSIQFVGKNWPISKRERVAELLFSTESNDSKNPKGIGLSSWRFNVGAGSMEQGSNSNISDEWRRAECFLNQDGSYNWDKLEGQQWFVKKAASYGIEDFTAFVNSPPVFYTKNEKAYSADGIFANLNADRYLEFATFLTSVISNVQSNNGIQFDYISPFNEPQWDWKCCGQEGSPWNNDEITSFTKVLDKAISQSELNTKIEVTEAGSLDFLYSNKRDARRNDQIWNFFSLGRDTYIGDLENVSKSIAGHSYFTTYDINTLVNTRKQLKAKIQEVDPSMKFVMSEYTILEDNEEIKGNGRDLGMLPAIYMARVIHADLVFANAVSWNWWLAVSPYDYKDGLIYIDNNKNTGNIYESKMLWGMGNYSRFVRPGMSRIEVTCSDNLSDIDGMKGLLQSAFMSDKEIVVVLVNQSDISEKVVFDGLGGNYSTIDMYQTSESKNLSYVRSYTDMGTKLIVSAKSIVTFVIK